MKKRKIKYYKAKNKTATNGMGFIVLLKEPITITLPKEAQIGDRYEIYGGGNSLFKISCCPGTKQKIFIPDWNESEFLTSNIKIGTIGGTIISTNINDCAEILCIKGFNKEKETDATFLISGIGEFINET